MITEIQRIRQLPWPAPAGWVILRQVFGGWSGAALVEVTLAECGVARGLREQFFAPLGKVGREDPFQERAAPAAASSGTKAIAELRGPLRSLDADVPQQLSQTDMEAEADFLIEIHRLSPDCAP